MVAWPLEAENLSPSVLITDDNASWRDVVEDVLARAGFRTLQASCGEEAIELVHGERVDIVLIDFHMPRLDGIQTLRIIRHENHWMPAVMMTGRPQEVPAEAVETLRVHTVLPKPTDRQVIVTTITRVVEKG